MGSLGELVINNWMINLTPVLSILLKREAMHLKLMETGLNFKKNIIKLLNTNTDCLIRLQYQIVLKKAPLFLTDNYVHSLIILQIKREL